MRAPSPLRLLVLGLALAGCGERKHPDGPLTVVAAEVHAPVYAAVKVHELDVKPECTETGLKRFSCFFQSELRGCAVLEVGREPLAPPEGFDDPLELLCDRGTFPYRVTVADQPLPVRGIQLEVDPLGTRVAWRAAPDKNWEIFYVLDGQLLQSSTRAVTAASGSSDSAPDWARVPTLADQASLLVGSAQSGQLAKLLAIIRDEEGEAGLARALANTMHLAEEAPWRAAFASLGSGGRTTWNAEAAEALQEDPAGPALELLMTHARLRPDGFADLLAGTAELELDSGAVDGMVLGNLAQALLELGDPRAGPLACGWLEQSVSASLLGVEEGLPFDLAIEEGAEALQAIARQKTACPWVRVALERDPCNLDYRCTPAGLVETSDEAMAAEDRAAEEAAERGEEEPPLSPQRALCGATVVTRLADAMKPPWYLPPEAEEDEDALLDPPIVAPGTLLLAAGYAQGPLPPDFLKRNQRRLYTVVDRSPKPGAEGELDPSACQLLDQSFSDAAEIACRVPVNLTRVTLSGCRIEIDDARKTITLTPPKAPARLPVLPRPPHRD